VTPNPAWAMPGLRMARPGQTKRPGVMNKLEEAYSWALEADRRAGLLTWYAYEAITLRIAHDCRYTPDFAVRTAGGQLEFHEVKGYMREDARIKLRVAASMFPFRFLLARRASAGWVIEEVT